MQYSKLEDKFPYEFDISNNRTEKQTSYYNDYQSQQESSVYTYQPGTNRLTCDGEYTYTYDKDGSLTGRQNQFIHYKYEWNLQNRLSKVYVKKLRQGWKAEWEDGLTEEQKQVLYDEFLLIFEAAYDESSRRYWKKARQTDGTWKETWSVYTQAGLLYEKTIHTNRDGSPVNDPETGTNVKESSYIYAAGSKMAQIEGSLDIANTDADNEVTSFPAESIKYMVSCQLGSTRLMLDGNGDVKWFSSYEPFGQNTNEKSFDEQTTTDQCFTSYTRDIEIGMHYAMNRYMDSEIGRFISEDPVKDGLNWYVYTANNPLRWVDPSGLGYHYIDEDGYSCYVGSANHGDEEFEDEDGQVWTNDQYQEYLEQEMWYWGEEGFDGDYKEYNEYMELFGETDELNDVLDDFHTMDNSPGIVESLKFNNLNLSDAQLVNWNDYKRRFIFFRLNETKEVQQERFRNEIQISLLKISETNWDYKGMQKQIITKAYEMFREGRLNLTSEYSADTLPNYARGRYNRDTRSIWIDGTIQFKDIAGRIVHEVVHAIFHQDYNYPWVYANERSAFDAAYNFEKAIFSKKVKPVPPNYINIKYNRAFETWETEHPNYFIQENRRQWESYIDPDGGFRPKN